MVVNQVDQLERAPIARHGATGYVLGCRCATCRRDHATLCREWNRRRSARNRAAGLTWDGRKRKHPKKTS